MSKGKRQREEAERRDIEIINKHADELNAEAEDALGYQAEDEEPDIFDPQPDPIKLFLVLWVFPVAYLCLIAGALYFGRSLIPESPVRSWLAYVMLSIVVWADVTGGIVAKALKMSVWDRPPVFRSLAWAFVGTVLLILEYGTLAFFLFTSWRWFIFALIMYQLIGMSGLVRKLCNAMLMGGCLAVLAAMQRRR